MGHGAAATGFKGRAGDVLPEREWTEHGDCGDDARERERCLELLFETPGGKRKKARQGKAWTQGCASGASQGATGVACRVVWRHHNSRWLPAAVELLCSLARLVPTEIYGLAVSIHHAQACEICAYVPAMGVSELRTTAAGS